jgi:HSP20 family molecular chaperone IbpA
MAAEGNKVEPEVCTSVDPQAHRLKIEIVLPGVLKRNIRLKVNTRCLVLSAAAASVNYEKYVLFNEPVVAEKAKAVYEHGLLRIEIPLRA